MTSFLNNAQLQPLAHKHLVFLFFCRDNLYTYELSSARLRLLVATPASRGCVCVSSTTVTFSSDSDGGGEVGVYGGEKLPMGGGGEVGVYAVDGGGDVGRYAGDTGSYDVLGSVVEVSGVKEEMARGTLVSKYESVGSLYPYGM